MRNLLALTKNKSDKQRERERKKNKKGDEGGLACELLQINVMAFGHACTKPTKKTNKEKPKITIKYCRTFFFSTRAAR